MLSSKERVKLCRLNFLLQSVGEQLLKVTELGAVAKRFVYGEKSEKVLKKTKEGTAFVAETESLLFICPQLCVRESHFFREFHDFSVDSAYPMAKVLVTRREECRRCKKKLLFEEKRHPVVIYDNSRGTFLGCRVVKFCRSCKIYEHHGFWTTDGERQFDLETVLNEDYLLSSEETAFDMKMLKMYESLLIEGAVPFSTFARSYNRTHAYVQEKKNCEATIEEPLSKRQKRKKSDDLHNLLSERCMLDRRRLEEAFLLYGVLHVLKKHELHFSTIPYDRNKMLEMVTEPYHKSFMKKWGEHKCTVPGCSEVLVVDGNMKNARQVCACKSATELIYPGIIGSLAVGCPNTPAKGLRYCTEHKDLGSPFIDDSFVMDGKNIHPNTKNIADDGAMITEIMNEKETRQDLFYEVKWSDGRCSWVKKSNLPPVIREKVENGQRIFQKLVDVIEFGQRRKVFQMYEGGNSIDRGDTAKSTTIVASSGFAVNCEDDTVITEDGVKRMMTCGTEKDKQKAKNHKTAGILVVEKPCSIVVDVVELFGSESKTQVYAHLHNILEKEVLKEIKVICYDDACHLKKFSQNPKRSNGSVISKKMSEMEMVCDRFHFKNHVDSWCRKHCNPNKCSHLQDVNTEVCEQLFSWLSKFSTMTKHMNRWRFLFIMLYVLEIHNQHIMSSVSTIIL